MSARSWPAWAAGAACASLVVAGGLAVVLVAAHVNVWLLDEAVYKVSAVHYERQLPHSLFHDYAARSTSRLYALTLMPLFRLFDGDVAIRLGKMWNVLLWCSIAFPLWRLGRPLLTPWRLAAAVTLSVLAPWIIYTTALFTESMAMASFVWFTWAAMLAVRRPAWWRDLLVMAALAWAVTSRIQLAGILGGYVVIVGVVVWRGSDAEDPLRRRLRTALGALRGFPFTTALIAIGGVAFLYLRATGKLSHQGDTLLGAYNGTHKRPAVVTDGFAMVLVELLAVTAGLGVISMLVAVPWYANALGERVRDEAWWYALVTASIGLALVAFTAYGQGVFWGPITEERYWMYPFAFVWIAALEAAQRRSVQARQVLATGAVLTVVAGLLGSPRTLDAESVFLAPVLAMLGSLTRHGLAPITGSSSDLLGLLMLSACAGTWLAMRHRPRLPLEWLLGAGAVVQIALTITPLLLITGVLDHHREQRTGGGFAALGWVDRHAAGRVAWLDSEPRADRAALSAWQLNTLFWNGEIAARMGIVGSTPEPDTYPLGALTLNRSTADAATGRLSPGPPTAEVVAWHDSPYAQLAGRAMASSPAAPPLELVRLAQPVRLTFRTQGLSGSDGLPPAGAPPVVYDVWPQGPAASVTFTIGPSPQPATIEVRLAGVRRRVRVGPAGPVQTTLTACGAHLQGRLVTLAAGVQTPALAAAHIAPERRCRA